jgi:hypothetical protein
MGTTLKDLRFLLERVLLCELEEGRRRQYHAKEKNFLNNGDRAADRTDQLARPGLPASVAGRTSLAESSTATWLMGSADAIASNTTCPNVSEYPGETLSIDE